MKHEKHGNISLIDYNGSKFPIIKHNIKKHNIGDVLIVNMIQSVTGNKPDGFEVLQVATSIAENYENVIQETIFLEIDGEKRSLPINELLKMYYSVEGKKFDRIYIIGHHYDSQACINKVVKYLVPCIRSSENFELVLTSCNSANYNLMSGSHYEYNANVYTPKTQPLLKDIEDLCIPEEIYEPVLFEHDIDNLPEGTIFEKAVRTLQERNIKGSVVAFNSLIFHDQHEIGRVNSSILKSKKVDRLQYDQYPKSQHDRKNTPLLKTSGKILFGDDDSNYGRISGRINGITKLKMAEQENARLLQSSGVPIISFRL